jgi:predicted NUDIX family NTP pyrophosphohydrolase
VDLSRPPGATHTTRVSLARVVVFSAGILLHRPGPDGPLVLLGHMGGPFWARKDAGAWSVPKGEHGPDEDPLAAAVREFAEELGTPPPPGRPVDLGTVRQPSGKRLAVFALDGDLDADAIVSNTFALEWPRGSGRVREFPEVDRAAWFGLADARRAVVRGQLPFLDRLEELLARAG